MARKAGKVSIFTMAAELGISAATVSRVLNNRTGVGEHTRAMVLELARKYQFRLNYPQQHQPIIATVIPVKSGISSYIAHLLTGIYAYFASHPFRVNTISANSGQSHPTILESVREQQCSGIILCKPTDFSEQIPELASCGLPVMEIDERSDIPGIGFIDNDSYAGAVELTEHLLSLGHRHIGFLMCWPNDLNHIQRYNGYADTMRRAGIEPSEKWLVRFNDNLIAGLGPCAAMMLDELLLQAPEITAVIAVNDEIAIGAMHHALTKGLKVPEYLSIAGFDNNDFCTFVTPELTSVAHPSVDAGFLAAEAVAEYISNFGTKPLPRRILPTHLVIRNSTGPARQN